MPLVILVEDAMQQVMVPLGAAVPASTGTAMAPTPERCLVSTRCRIPEGYHCRLASTQRFVTEADVIVRAVAVDGSGRPMRHPALLGPRAGNGLVVRPVETLHGILDGETLTRPGRLVAREDSCGGSVTAPIMRRCTCP